MPKSIVLKILTVGDGGVGKTTLLHRFIEGEFLSDTKMTMGVSFFNKQLIIDDNIVQLQLWDFGGQEQFRFMLRKYALGARGAILMFDLTRIGTLENFDEWVDICRENDKNLPIILVGTKLDLSDGFMLDDEYIEEIKQNFNLFEYIKISSKTGENVEDVFMKLTKRIIKLSLL